MADAGAVGRRSRGSSVTGPPPLLSGAALDEAGATCISATGGRPSRGSSVTGPAPVLLQENSSGDGGSVDAVAHAVCVGEQRAPASPGGRRSRGASVTGPAPFLALSEGSASAPAASAPASLADEGASGSEPTAGPGASGAAGDAALPSGTLAGAVRTRTRSDTGVTANWSERIDLRAMCTRKLKQIERDGPSKYDADDMDESDFEQIANVILGLDKTQLNHIKQCKDPACPDGCLDLAEPVVRKAVRLFERFHRVESLETVCNELARKTDPRSRRKQRSSISVEDFGLKALVDSFLVEMLTTVLERPAEAESK